MNTFKSLLLSSLLATTPVVVSAAPSLELSGTGSLDIKVDDLDAIKDYGDVISVRDLDLRADSQLTEWLSARLILACNDKAIGDIDDCVSTARDILKDFTVGVMVPEFGGQKVVVLMGKTELPFGGASTKRAIDIHNTLNQKDRELERKKVIMIQWAPKIAGQSKAANIMNELFSLVEVGTYSHNSDDFSDFAKTSDYDNYVGRVSGALKKLFYTASYLDEKNGETRWGVSAGMPVLSTGFAVYGEYQNYKNNAVDPNLESAATVGVSKALLGGSGAVEFTDISSKDKDAKNRMAVSYTRPVGKHFGVGAELDAETDLDDATLYMTVNGKFGKSKNIETRSLFPQIQSKVDAQRAQMDEARKRK